MRPAEVQVRMASVFRDVAAQVRERVVMDLADQHKVAG